MKTLSVDLLYSRADRPDEWTMDRFIEKAERLEDKLNKILNWCNAYPVDVFPEPDFKKAAKVLKDNGMTLDSISASNMRHVLKGVKDIIGGD